MFAPSNSSKLFLALCLGVHFNLSTAQEMVPGRDVASLLRLAQTQNAEQHSLRHEAQAAQERIESAAALPNPKLRAELMDITREGQQNPNLLPARAGSARYTLMQDLPWFGKRELKRNIAELDAASAQARASTQWSELAAKIKTTYAQLYYLHRTETLTQEILDLNQRLEKISLARYANGMGVQQDVIRAQLEQSSLRGELIALKNEQHHLHRRLNAWLARPTQAALAEPEQLRPLPAPEKLEPMQLEALARQHNPLLASEHSRVQSAEKSRDLTYKNSYPDLTIGITPNQFQNAVKQWDVMFEVTLPLQQTSRRAQEREAESMLAAAQARQEATQQQVLADLSENLAALEAARRMELLATNSLVPQAEFSFKSALSAYENGKLDFATLLEAQRQIRQAKQTSLRAQAESQARLADIERLVGEDL